VCVCGVAGVAFTVDPAHAKEVRAYLGTFTFQNASFRDRPRELRHSTPIYVRISTSSSSIDHREKVRYYSFARLLSFPILILSVQDGYTLERVDVYGLVDGVHETVVIPGAECYVGRNDNPSFGACVPSSLLVPHPLIFDDHKSARSPSAHSRIPSGMRWVRQARTRYAHCALDLWHACGYYCARMDDDGMPGRTTCTNSLRLYAHSRLKHTTRISSLSRRVFRARASTLD
jgi:hypothetical protein